MAYKSLILHELKPEPEPGLVPDLITFIQDLPNLPNLPNNDKIIQDLYTLNWNNTCDPKESKIDYIHQDYIINIIKEILALVGAISILDFIAKKIIGSYSYSCMYQ